MMNDSMGMSSFKQENLQKYIPQSQLNHNEQLPANFLSHRKGLKSFYKNEQYKLMTT